MSFKTMMASDMANAILNTDEFAESITYVDKLGVEKTINAIIDRERLDRLQEGGDFLGKEIVVVIANDATNGVTSINTGRSGRDGIKAPEFLGETAIDWRIAEIIKHDSASWTLRCVK